MQRALILAGAATGWLWVSATKAAEPVALEITASIGEASGTMTASASQAAPATLKLAGDGYEYILTVTPSFVDSSPDDGRKVKLAIAVYTVEAGERRLLAAPTVITRQGKPATVDVETQAAGTQPLRVVVVPVPPLPAT